MVRNVPRSEMRTHQATNDSTHIENSPEPTKVSSLLILMGVRDHDSSLRSPQKTGADTKKSSRNDVKWADIGMSRSQ